MKVAIVGLWSQTRPMAHWDDPTWEKWGMTWDAEVFRMDRAFEMHSVCEWKAYAPKDYIERLQMLPNLYLQEAHPELPHAKVYPFQEVTKDVAEYWASSVGYMLALAIHEKAEEIGIYGCSMEAHDEYSYQRPNVEYLIGLARGRGITVHVPQESHICKFNGQYGYSGRYGRFEA